jgi:hypothetical protein
MDVLTSVMPLVWGIGAMAEFNTAIDGDAKGTKHRRSAGHDVHLAERRL